MPIIDRQLSEAIRNPRERGFWILVLLFVALLAAGALFVCWIRPIPFSSAAWKQQERLRSRMVEDLLDNHALVGASRAEIDGLLGIPSGRNSPGDDRYVYWMGSAGIDDAWLEIQFRDDRVIDVHHVSD